MNERQVQHGIWLALKASSRVMMPNYTPPNWWECDVFAVTNAGYFHEYEIKLTVADFRNDAKKKKWRVRMELDKVSKYDRMEAKDPHGPTAFWYVVPQDLIGPDDVPAWAGLIYVTAGEYSGSVNLRRIKPAPRRHATKIAGSVVEHCREVCYWRYWKEIGKNAKLENA